VKHGELSSSMLMRWKRLKIKRVYLHCDLLEEAPMWDSVSSNKWDSLADSSATLFREIDCFYNACKRVIAEWPNSCLHNLSNRSLNRCSWLGQSACFVELGSVEYTARLGWRMLDNDEKLLANECAMRVIKEWENKQCQK